MEECIIITKTFEKKKLYSVTEVSKLTGIGKVRIYDLINNHHLKALNIGGLKIPESEIDAFIERATGYDFTDMKNIVPLGNVHDESIGA